MARRNPVPLFRSGGYVQDPVIPPDRVVHGPSMLLGAALGLLVAAVVWLVSTPTYCGLKKHSAHYLTDRRITWQSACMVPEGASGGARQAQTP